MSKAYQTYASCANLRDNVTTELEFEHLEQEDLNKTAEHTGEDVWGVAI